MKFTKNTLLIVALSATALLAGCATTGNEHLESATQLSTAT